MKLKKRAELHALCMRVARKNLSLLGTQIARDCDLGVALGFVGGYNLQGRCLVDRLFFFVSRVARKYLLSLLL